MELAMNKRKKRGHNTLEHKLLAFWSKVQKSEGCWEWTGCVSKNGYGSFTFDGVSMCAHRAAWFIAYGEWPKERDVDHICRNRRCVRIGHLRNVSHSENILARPISQKCHRGHPLADPNLYYYKSNGKQVRRCLKCILIERERVKLRKSV